MATWHPAIIEVLRDRVVLRAAALQDPELNYSLEYLSRFLYALDDVARCTEREDIPARVVAALLPSDRDLFDAQARRAEATRQVLRAVPTPIVVSDHGGQS